LSRRRGFATLLAQGVAIIGFVWRSGAAMPCGCAYATCAPPGRCCLSHAHRAPAVGERVVLNVAIMTYFAVPGISAASPSRPTPSGRGCSSPGSQGRFSVAAATLVGHALGATTRSRRKSGWRAARLALGVDHPRLARALRIPIARVFTSDQGVIERSAFMLMLALAQPPMGVHFTLGGALRGAGDTWTPLVAAFLGNWAFRVPLAYVFSQGFDLGITWVWAALIADHFVRAAWLAASFRRGRWRRRVGATV
jgi:hypothetical protein